MNIYNDLAKYYDVLFNADYAKEARICDSILKRLNNSKGALLDIGCGTGNHMLEFKKLGYDVYGLDSSKEMLEIARQKLPKATFYKGRMEWLHLNRKFNTITLLSRTLLLIESEWYLKHLIKRLHNHLLHNGVIIIDLDVNEEYFNKNYNKTEYFRKGNDLQGSFTESHDLRKNKILWSINLSIKDGEAIRNVKTQEYLLINVNYLLKIMRKAGFKTHVYSGKGRETDNYKQPLLIAGVKEKL